MYGEFGRITGLRGMYHPLASLKRMLRRLRNMGKMYGLKRLRNIRLSLPNKPDHFRRGSQPA